MSTESWVVAGPQVIEVEDLRALRVGLVGGRVDVVAHDDPDARGARLEVHRVDGRPLGSSLGAAGVLVAMLAVLVVGALTARAVVTDLPWLALLVALVAGAATAGLLRWWQLRPVPSPV